VKIKWASITVNLLMSGIIVSAIALRAAAPVLTLPATVTGVQVLLSAPTRATQYSFTTSGIPAGLSLTNQTYGAWCTNPNLDLPGGGGTAATYNVYSSYATNLPIDGNAGESGTVYGGGTTVLSQAQEMQVVNYILNHLTGTNGNIPATPNDIQGAIWQLLHPNDSVFYVIAAGTTTAALALYNDAIAHGIGFVPGAGQVVAVVLDPQTPYQGIIVPVPLPTACITTGLSLGSDANYIFIDTGNTHLGWNAYQLNGDVLFGQGLTVQLSGGNNGGLGAGYKVYTDSTTNISGKLQNPLTFASVSTSVTAAAAASAQSVSNNASGLTATQTFSTINNNMTINGNGGLNVIDVGSIQNANFTIHGSANDYFVFNVSRGIQTNRVMTLTGGVPASHILWNLTGSGTVLQTSGGDVLVGTFLATKGGQFQFSELQLTGELINTGGNIQLVSGNHALNHIPFCK